MLVYGPTVIGGGGGFTKGYKTGGAIRRSHTSRKTRKRSSSKQLSVGNKQYLKSLGFKIKSNNKRKKKKKSVRQRK